MANDWLHFKISVGDGIDRSATRDRIRKRLHQIAETLDLPIRRPDHLGSGQTMTLAHLHAEQTGFGSKTEWDRFARTVATAQDAVGRLA